MGIGQHRRIVQRAIRGPGGDHHRAAVMGQRRAVGIGAETDLCGIPGQLAAAMAPQMHHRRPAARHGNGVAGDILQHGALAGLQAERNTRDPLAALDLGNGTARLDADAKRAGAVGQRAGDGAAGVHDAGHGQARLHQRDGGAVGIVIVGDDHGAVTGRDRLIDHIVAHRRGQHHAGNVIAREGQGALDGPGRGQNPARADAPQPMLGAPVAGGVVGDTFIRQHIAMIIDPGPGAAQPQGDRVHRGKGRHRGIDPVLRRFAIDLQPVHRGAATPMGGLFQQHHPQPGTGGNERRLQPGNPAADHQQVAKGIGLFIAVRIAVLGRFAQARRLADDRLEHMFPEGARVDEGLVIEARRQKTRDIVVQHAHIEFQAGPVVLAGRDQPVEQFGGGGALVGFQPRALPQIEQRIGLFRTRAHDSPRAVILEAAPDQHLVIGQQRRGQRIAKVAAQALAVEGEVGCRRPVDQAAATGQTRAHWYPFQPGRRALIFATISGGGAPTCAG